MSRRGKVMQTWSVMGGTILVKSCYGVFLFVSVLNRQLWAVYGVVGMLPICIMKEGWQIWICALNQCLNYDYHEISMSDIVPADLFSMGEGGKGVAASIRMWKVRIWRTMESVCWCCFCGRCRGWGLWCWCDLLELCSVGSSLQHRLCQISIFFLWLQLWGSAMWEVFSSG